MPLRTLVKLTGYTPALLLEGMKKPKQVGKARQMQVRPARCANVLAILNNSVETLAFLREEVHPSAGDFGERSMDVAVVGWKGIEVCVPIGSVVFLHGKSKKRR